MGTKLENMCEGDEKYNRLTFIFLGSTRKERQKGNQGGEGRTGNDAHLK